MDTLEWLMGWYQSNCDGLWEYAFNTQIHVVGGSLKWRDGWYFELLINGTPNENVPFEKVKIDRTSSDWVYCEVDEGTLKCYCGPKNLKEALNMVRKWVSDSTPAD